MKDHGLDYSNFYCVMPVPGTPIYDYAIQNGHLPSDYNPDIFQWTRANLRNILVPQDELELIRDKTWNDCNSDFFKESRRKWVVNSETTA